jgi:hypothetical protein
MHDFSVRTILIDLARTNGKKTALDKCAMLEQSLARFAGGDEVLKVIKDKTQATSMGSSMGLAMGRGSSMGGGPPWHFVYTLFRRDIAISTSLRYITLCCLI